ncbi:branched-chain amino acid ABC transporter permease [Pararhodobacter zhoushanensis]|uniref:Branched-chain amino acid ABC transporter permease n=1 Tax=Pararhodobacter zhoushanensis TaxID=2479545 RepID=A0ABT3H5D8_9RHOB|nr:branched-chain amino acid ABC transporter permease [Pararhodobacter zhoushanensis]MCW1934933.1 branched-chain amino acid ABC transporter permease [Pararhodobacter zhoushanensis]
MSERLLPMPGADRHLIGGACALLVLLVLAPVVAPALVVDKLTQLGIYVLLAFMWNLLAGYAGLVSVGQQAFVGLGGYAMVRLVEAGVGPFPALVLAPVLVAGVAWLLAWFVLRLKIGEFAIAMWVIAEVFRQVVMFDPLVQGETGTSLIALNAFDPEVRRTVIYLLTLAAATGALVGSYLLLRGRLGAEAQAIRDDEEAAAAVGVSTFRVKRLIFVVAAAGCALAGTLWLASAITFQPRTGFGIQWTVFMLFMVLTGGLGTFAGPLVGAVLLMALQELFGDIGAWYLFGVGALAIGFALFLPGGLVGALSRRQGREPLTMRRLLADTRR